MNNSVRMFQDLLSAAVDLVLLSIQMDCPVMVHNQTLMINVKRFENYTMREATTRRISCGCKLLTKYLNVLLNIKIN